MKVHCAGRSGISRFVGRFRRATALLGVGLLAAGGALVASPVSPAHATATTITITPLSWNMVGLDSNNVTVGPNMFPIGARVCNTGAAAADNLTVTWNWTTSNTYVNLDGAATVTRASVATSSCVDIYYTVVVTRNSAAYMTSRKFVITASATNASAVSTPSNREIFVEKLISQGRNAVYGVSGLPATGYVGDEYTIVIDGGTATGGYEQLEAFLTLPGSVFQINSVTITYAVPAAPHAFTNDQFWGDACGWDQVIGLTKPQGTYKSCLNNKEPFHTWSGDKVGGDPIKVTMHVKVIAAGTVNTSAVLFDFSGSSFHYNADYTAKSYTAVDSTVTAVDDYSITKKNEYKDIDVKVNDTTNVGTIDPTSVTIVTGPAHGTVTVDPVTGVVRYTPTTDYVGTDQFTYRICNSLGKCTTAVGYITIQDPATPIPHLSVTKTVTDGGSPTKRGDVITYEIVATNDGETTLTDVNVTDANATIGSCTPSIPVASLAVNDTITCSATHAVTAAEVNAEQVVNIAVAEGKNGSQTVRGTGQVTVPVVPGSMTVLKSVTAGGLPTKSGDTITYQIVATNTGAGTLHSVFINETNATITSCDTPLPADLAPSASITCTATHLVTDTEAANYLVENVATGTSPDIDPVASNKVVTLMPHLTVTKSVTGRLPKRVGDLIHYSIVALNDGKLPLTNVTITDDNATGLACTPSLPVTSLEVGSRITCTATHAVTQDEMTAGHADNVASATADEIGPIDSNKTIVPLAELPETGAATGGAAGIGIVMTLLGAGALLLARRRRLV